MRGILITNAYWHSESTDAMRDLFLKAAEEKDIELTEISNDADFSRVSADFAILWDKDVRLGALLEKRGIPVFNSPLSVALCDDKTLTHLALTDSDIPLPETVICPQTFPINGYKRWDFLDRAPEGIELNGIRLLQEIKDMRVSTTRHTSHGTGTESQFCQIIRVIGTYQTYRPHRIIWMLNDTKLIRSRLLLRHSHT